MKCALVTNCIVLFFSVSCFDFLALTCSLVGTKKNSHRLYKNTLLKAHYSTIYSVFMSLKYTTLIACIVVFAACKKSVTGTYTGTASVSEGLATTTTENLYAKGIRVAAVVSITAQDNTTWMVPA